MVSGNTKKKIAIIGAGNVGTNLAFAFYNVGHSIAYICSRTQSIGTELAEKTKAIWIDDVLNLPSDADIYIIAVSDDAINDVVQKLNPGDGLVVHTSGALSIEILSPFRRCGIFYPLQTFSKNHILDFSKIPICIEANLVDNQQELDVFAKSISKVVFHLSSSERLQVHISAVFVCNFVNYMYTMGFDYLEKQGIPPSILMPLIAETASKITQMTPKMAQTGPAKRKDRNTVAQHMELLKDNERYLTVYKILSAQIEDYFIES